MKRRTFFAAIAPFVQTVSRTAVKRPNVVMFMTDDHGAWATGAYGCAEMHTPNIDSLAKGGAAFTRAVAATPVCSPSRMTYMTGRLPSTHRVQDWLRPVDSFGPKSRDWLAEQPTYSGALARSGYTLGFSGKWHMGHDERAHAGFSFWATVPGGGGSYKNVEFVKNGEKDAREGFKTDRVTDFALDFLDTRKGKDDPFYLLLPFYAPHTPYDYQPEEYRKHYNNSSFSCFPDAPQHPWANRGLRAHYRNKASMHAYSALISGVDHNVGRVLSQLNRIGARENTVVIFTADQGWNSGHHGFWGKGNGTWPFNMYEESIRVPMIWNHPGSIQPGQVLDPMVSSYDYHRTILDYTGVSTPPDKLSPGRSYADFLRGKKPKWDNRLIFEYSMVRALRTENLKLILRTKEWPSELYDLEADPGETKNLFDDAGYGARRQALTKELEARFRQYNAPDLENWRSTAPQELTTYER
jgi:arylsulfatase A-like enzyme